MANTVTPSSISAFSNILNVLNLIGQYGFLAFFFYICIYFRRELKAILKRLPDLTFEHDKTKVSFKNELEKMSESTADQTSPRTVEPAVEVSRERTEPSDLIDRYIDLASLKDGDRKLLETAYIEMQQKEKDEVKRLNNEAMHCYFLFSYFGDEEAFTKLKSLSNREESTQNVKHWLASAYEKSWLHNDAIAVLEEAAKITEGEEHARCIARLAKGMFNLDQHSAASTRLMDEIAKEKSKECRSILFETLAEIFEKTGQPVLRALALEKALEGRPNDRKLRFDIAYLYDKEAFVRLSIFHYKKDIAFHEDNPASLNNLGYEFSRINMNLKSVQTYKLAADKGHALAMSNLARNYLNAGFEEEARSMVEKAKVLPSFQDSMGSVLSSSFPENPALQLNFCMS